MIIDAHTHIGKWQTTSSFEQVLGQLSNQMKEAGVDKSLIIAWIKNDENFNVSTNKLIELIEGKNNFRAIGSVDLENYGPADTDRLEGWLKEKKIVGIKFYLGYQHVYPYEERCRPIYELCLKYNVPAVFHTGDTLAGGVSNPKLKYSHPIHVDEVAVDFPNLKIVVAHLGNPWLIDCAEILYKNKNVYADISGLVIGDDLGSNYGDLMRNRIKELVAYAGDTKLLYGTDWPLAPMAPYIKFAKSLGLSLEGLERLFYKNAVELFNLN